MTGEMGIWWERASGVSVVLSLLSWWADPTEREGERELYSRRTVQYGREMSERERERRCALGCHESATLTEGRARGWR